MKLVSVTVIVPCREHAEELGNTNSASGRAAPATSFVFKPWQLRAGAWWFVVPLVIAKRLAYIFGSVVRHRPHDQLRLPLLLPTTFVGLLAYTVGFRALRQKRQA